MKRSHEVLFESLGDEKSSGEVLQGDATPKPGEVVEEIQLKRKEVKKRLKVSTERLLGVDGIQRIYEEFPLICQFKGRGTEAKYLSNLIDRYKEWSFQLYPSFQYTEVLDRTYILSKDSLMKNTVEQLRREECDRRMREKYGVIIPKDTYSDDENIPANQNIETSADATTATTNEGGNQSASGSLSDDIFLQAMLEFDQVAQQKTTNKDQDESHDVELSDSDEEEFNMSSSSQVPANVSATTGSDDGQEDVENEDTHAIYDDETEPQVIISENNSTRESPAEASNDGNERDVLNELLAMDSVVEES